MTHRKAPYAFKVGGSPGLQMRCFVDPSWFFVSFVFQNATTTADPSPPSAWIRARFHRVAGKVVSVISKKALTRRCDGICLDLRYLRFLRAMVRWLINVMIFAMFFAVLAFFAFQPFERTRVTDR